LDFPKLSQWMVNSKVFPKSHHMGDSNSSSKCDGFFFFLLHEGMLSTSAIAAESAQNCPSLPHFVKIFPKTISLRNFEIPPKFEVIIIFWKRKVLVQRRRIKACAHHLNFQCNSFWYAFSIVKKCPLDVNFSIIPCGKSFFSQCSTPLAGVRFSRQIINSPTKKNKMLHNPCLFKKIIFWAF
jgi:hypothetical protein